MKMQIMGVFALMSVFALAGCQSGGGSASASNPTSTAPPTNQGSGNNGGGGTTPPVPGATYKISGTIAGSTIANITITATPGGNATTTGKGGTYTLTGLSNGHYTVTPSYSSLVFTPASRTITVRSAAVTGVNFSDPFSVLKESTLLYVCQNAFCQKNLATGSRTAILTLQSGEQPRVVVPFYFENRVAYTGDNIKGIYTTSTKSPSPVLAIGEDTNLTSKCGLNAEMGHWFTVADTSVVGDVALVQALCKSGPNIFIVPMSDGSGHVIQVTDDNENELSPVIAEISSSGKAVVLYVKTTTDSKGVSTSAIMEQIVDLVATPNIVGAPTVFTKNVVNSVRTLSLNATRTKIAFVRVVSGIAHIFVKPLTGGGTAIDLGPGNNPYWSKYKIGESSLILYSTGGPISGEAAKLYAVSPDGSTRYSVPIPKNELPWSETSIVFAPLP